MTSDVINVPRGSVEYVPVRVERRGYNGPIQLFVPEKIHGIAAEEGRIEAGQNEGYILLSAKPGTTPSTVPIEIWGRGGNPAQPIDRQAAGNAVNLAPFVDRQLLEPMPSALCQETPFTVQVAARSIRIPHGIGGSLPVTIQRGPAATEAIRIEPRPESPVFPFGVDTNIEKGKADGAITFPGNVEYGRSQGTMVFTAISQVAGREVRVTLPRSSSLWFNHSKSTSPPEAFPLPPVVRPICRPSSRVNQASTGKSAFVSTTSLKA